MRLDRSFNLIFKGKIESLSREVTKTIWQIPSPEGQKA